MREPEIADRLEAVVGLLKADEDRETVRAAVSQLRGVAALTKELEETRRVLCISEEYRQAYRNGKYKLYEMGGAILEAAAKHLPCSEGPLERWVRYHVIMPQFGMLLDDLHVTALALAAFDWRPIETAPKDGTKVLIYDRAWCGGRPNITVSQWQRYEVIGNGPREVRGSWSGVTHATLWMPVPSVPEVLHA